MVVDKNDTMCTLVGKKYNHIENMLATNIEHFGAETQDTLEMILRLDTTI